MLSTRRKIVAAALESTAGTAETLDNTDTPFWGFDPNIQNQVSFTARTGAGTLSQISAMPGVENGQFTFGTELYQGAPWAAILMPAIGFTNGGSGTSWSPSDTPADFKTLTTGANIGGKLKTIAAAMGSVRFNLTPGQPVRADWTFSGRYQAEADATQFTPAFAASAYNAAPKFASATTTLDGTAICWGSGTLEIQNTVELILCQNAVGGIDRAWISDRVIRLTIDPLEVLAATRNDDALQRARTEHAFSLAYSNMSITCPKMQRLGITPGERNGLSARQIVLQANMNSAAGDEIVIDFDTTD